jgi:hypothetical protein
MSDKPQSISDRWSSKVPLASVGPKSPPPAAVQDVDSASTLNPAKRQQQLMVDFRLKDGNSQAFTYAYLMRMTCNPTVSIILEFTGYRVTLTGKNLRRLYRRLLAHQVGRVQQVDRVADLAGSTVTRIYGIAIEERKG